MKGAGLEQYFAPKDALVSKASDEVAKQIEARVDSATAKAILDPSTSPALSVDTQVVQTGETSDHGTNLT